MKRVVFGVVAILMIILVGKMVMGGNQTKNIRIYYESVAICSGDTLWNIAQKYNIHGVRIKTYVAEIMAFNQMENENIVSGQKILIPVRELVAVN